MSKLFPAEVDQFIRDNVTGLRTQELTDLVNKRFNTNYSSNQIRAYKKSRKLKSGLEFSSKGLAPPNKGVKVSDAEREKLRAMGFKKGYKNPTAKPIGAEYINPEGYTYVKISDDPDGWSKNWKRKHLLIYEQNFGPIPDGCSVIFADGNKSNFDPDNLVLVTQEELLYLSQNNLRYNDIDLTKVGVMIAKLNCTIRKKIKEVKS